MVVYSDFNQPHLVTTKIAAFSVESRRDTKKHISSTMLNNELKRICANRCLNSIFCFFSFFSVVCQDFLRLRNSATSAIRWVKYLRFFFSLCYSACIILTRYNFNITGGVSLNLNGFESARGSKC